MEENNGKKKVNWKKVFTIIVAVGGAVAAALGEDKK